MQALVATGGLAILFAAGGESVDPKGIFVDDGGNRHTNVKFNVLLDRDGRERTVNSDYRFLDGDRVKFQFQLNRESCHRTTGIYFAQMLGSWNLTNFPRSYKNVEASAFHTENPDGRCPSVLLGVTGRFESDSNSVEQEGRAKCFVT